MSLRPIRQTEQVNIDFICPHTQERGGCLSFASASGIDFAEYSANPSGSFVLGIQLNDIEWMNLSRQYHRTFSRNGISTDVPFGTVGIGVQGDWVTDWLYLIGSPTPGDVVYAGPSGTFTNSSDFGAIKIGTFIGPLEENPHLVCYRGLGFSREYVDPYTKTVVTENDPNDRILIPSPGFIKIRIDVGKK
jgi:hypothetical protein